MNQEWRRISEYLYFVSSAGSMHPAYDGLRIFQHPARAVLQLADRSAEIFPLTLEMWPSLSCNARCRLCPYRMSGSRDVADANPELFLSENSVSIGILREFSRLGGRSVIFTGGGEPLLNPGIVQLAQAAVEFGLRWALFTNGSLLSEAFALRLLSLRPAFLRISIDAGTALEHNRVYSLGTSGLAKVMDNAVRSACIAARLGLRSFGVSFTLSPRISDDELMAIAELIVDLEGRGRRGLGLVAFRPRVVHYRRGVPVAPQALAGEYDRLARRIESLVLGPVKLQCPEVRTDIKRGLFVLADRPGVLPCLSSCWTTTASEDAQLWMIPELAGSAHSWGRYCADGDLRRLWESPLRHSQLRRVESGELPVPVVHRTSPIDELVRGLTEVMEPVSLQEARQIVTHVTGQDWYRSANADFA